jgi:ComEC/Rec2-related protein
VVLEVVSHDTTHSIVIEDLTIDGEKISGKLCVRLNDDDKATALVRIGDKISFFSRPIISKISFDNLSSHEIKYYAYTSLDALSLQPGTLDFRQQILGSLKATFNKWLGKYGNVAYSVVTGDKNGLTNEFRSAYSVSGISHILAVSGLHVGFLMSLILAMLNLFKVHKKARPWICISILLLYNFIVGFSFSVIRASIMFVVAYLARLRNKPNDQLNNLCFSISVILCIFPYALFDVGFIMSVGCVLAIILFNKGLTEFLLKLTKNKCKKLVSAIAISICAQIGVFPAMVFYFSSISTYSTIANVLAMPILNLIYVFVLVMGILTCFLPFLGYVLYLAKHLFIIIDWINAFISFLPLSQITLYGSIGIFSMYVMYVISSRFIMLPKKFIAVSLCVLLSVGIVLVDNLRFLGDTHIVYANARYDVTTLLKTDDKFVIVGDMTKYCKIETCVKNSRAHAIDSIYVTHLENKNVDYVIKLANKYRVNTVYVREETDPMLVQYLVLNNVNVDVADYQTRLSVVEQYGEFIGYKYKNVLLTSYKTKLNNVSKEYLSTYKVVRAYSCKEIDGINFALNFTYIEKENSVGANEDTVLLDCNTLNKKRF